MIINSDYNTLTIIEDNKLFFRQINEYNILKHKDFEGKRIMIKLNDDTEVLETFNNGIFNVRHKNKNIQLHDKQELAKRLVYCMNNKTDKPIIDLMLQKESKQINRNYLIQALKPYYDKVKFTDKEIIVNNLFKVDNNGQAHKLNKGKWSFLCIVASKTNNETIKTDLGNLKLDFKTLEILYKVIFLLYPNKNDLIFMNQLTNEQKAALN